MKKLKKIFFICLVIFIAGFLFINIPLFNAVTLSARQSEARIQLAAIYDSQNAIFKESGEYSVCLDDLGYEPTRNGRYTLGFQNSVVSVCKSGGHFILKNFGEDLKNVKLVTTDLASKKYTVYAIGRIHPNKKYPLDVWSIDQDKNFLHVQKGNEPTIPLSFFEEYIQNYYYSFIKF